MYTKLKVIAALAMTLSSPLSFAQACNCTVVPQTDGSFNVKCQEATTIVLMINQPNLMSEIPSTTQPPPVITTKPPVVSPKPPVITETVEQKRIRLLKEKYANDPSVYIDDTGRMHFK